jgi:hypothetical protein
MPLTFKRLFKQAWHDNDHELMAAFLVRLDRSIRRSRSTRYLRINRTYEPYVTLLLKPRGKKIDFSTATTHYLRRRAWRYFRRVGFRSPADYCSVISKALLVYTDDDMRAGENLLDNWGLMHACFGKSPALAFGRRHTNVKVASGLGDLRALLKKLPAHDAAHGFVPGRSIVTNALPHVGSTVVVNCDLTDFFPSVTVHRVIGLFRQIGYSPAVATVLGLIVTESPRRKVLFNGKPWHVATGPRGLPQGACTSPSISN